MASPIHDSDGNAAAADSSLSPAASSSSPAALSKMAPMPIVAVDDTAAGGVHSTTPHATPATPPGSGKPAVLSPPYWTATTGRHGRAASIGSVASTISGGRRPPIRLEDNTEAETETPPTSAHSLPKSALWARVVRIPSHTLVAGTVRGVGDYVVWTCRVDTLDGGTIVLRKRYSEFAALRHALESTFPRSAQSLPALPPKSVLRRFQPGFLEKRRKGLEFFLNCTLLNPEFASSAILKEFVFR